MATEYTPDTTPVFRLIRRTRSLLRSSWVTIGLGMTVGLGVGALVLVTALDLLMPLLPAFRLAGLLLIIVPALWVFLVGVVRPLFRRLTAGHVARRIEAHLPGIHNRLVSCVDLRANGHAPAASPAFYRRLVHEAVERIRGFRPARVVDFLSLRRAGAFACASTATFVAVLCLFSDRVPVAMARIFSPFADIPPASGVKYTVEPGDARVLRDEDIVFRARVSRGEPAKLRLELKSDGDAETLWYDLEKQKDKPVWRFTLSGSLPPGYEDTFTYRVHGGGTWSPKYRITVVERPAIAEVHTILHYPEYMALPPRESPPRMADVTGPEGGKVEVVVQAEGSVARGSVQLLEYRQPKEVVEDRPERVWFEDRLPAGAHPGGAWKWDEARGRPAHTETPAPRAIGLYGHWFQETPAGFEVGAEDKLFAYLYIPRGAEPQAVMLEWNDGTSWEHRAYWGADVIHRGQPGTPACQAMGPLPEAGRWVRLEVPADRVGLQGKVLRGMGFQMFGGQCFWGRTGALPPVLTPVESFAMEPKGEGRWSGRFPLTGSGYYRVELHNELGYANKPMPEAHYASVPDNPPQVVLDRPGADVVLSKPERLPLVVDAHDDFGLADVILVVQKDGGAADTQSLRHYERPEKDDHLLAGLDLAALKVKAGEFVRYHAEARDRKGQVARTPDFVVRIAADPNAADQQLDAFDKSQDPFREKLAKLIAEQAKVQAAVEKVAAKYAPLDDKLRQARQDAAAAGKVIDPKTLPPVNLASTDQQVLKSLREEMTKLNQQEQQNVQTGQQVAGDLQRLADQAKNLKLLPDELANEMAALQQAFQQRAMQPLEDLSGKMQQGANPQQAPPDLKQMQRQSDRLQKELEAIQARVQAMTKAQQQMRQNVEQALAQLRNEMLKQRGALTARELDELRKALASLREQLQKQSGNQDQLRHETDSSPNASLPEKQRKQQDLQKQLEDLLRKVKQLQASGKLKKLKRRPDFPKSPYDPDEDDQLVRPKEGDPAEPETGDTKDKAKGDKTAKDKAKDDDDDEEPTYVPALGGPKPKIDPRYAKKMRPLTKKGQKGDKNDPEAERQDLQSRQSHNLDELDEAQQSLASDEQSLEQMMRQLQQALDQSGKPHSGQPHQGQDSEGLPSLADLLKSPLMQQALAMAGRMQRMQSQGNPPPGGQQPEGNMTGAQRNGPAEEAELRKLDPDTRGKILRLPPRLREELIQGMQEQGPEGYQRFIEDYFKRLTEVKEK
jgi:hypothetical protein